MFFLGCDGGSTKTELLIADENGTLYACSIFEGCNYAFLGAQGFNRLMSRAVNETLRAAALSASDLSSAVFGLPVYGELEETELAIPGVLRALLPGVPLRVENDALMGWSGALCAQPGIHVVSGTGSIIYGMDAQGNAVRVGGWSLLFADEGSCSWVGRQLITAFTQQADGRLPRTPLYELMREKFALKKDAYFSKVLQVDFRKDAAELAALQRLALEALRLGDETIPPIYAQAARELVLQIMAARRHLLFADGDEIPVSYSGGLFHAGGIVLDPLMCQLRQEGFSPRPPRFPPNVGAIALAASPYLSQEALKTMLEALCTQI